MKSIIATALVGAAVVAAPASALQPVGPESINPVCQQVLALQGWMGNEIKVMNHNGEECKPGDENVTFIWLIKPESNLINIDVEQGASFMVSGVKNVAGGGSGLNFFKRTDEAEAVEADEYITAYMWRLKGSNDAQRMKMDFIAPQWPEDDPDAKYQGLYKGQIPQTMPVGQYKLGFGNDTAAQFVAIINVKEPNIEDPWWQGEDNLPMPAPGDLEPGNETPDVGELPPPEAGNELPENPLLPAPPDLESGQELPDSGPLPDEPGSGSGGTPAPEVDEPTILPPTPIGGLLDEDTVVRPEAGNPPISVGKKPVAAAADLPKECQNNALPIVYVEKRGSKWAVLSQFGRCNDGLFAVRANLSGTKKSVKGACDWDSPGAIQCRTWLTEKGKWRLTWSADRVDFKGWYKKTYARTVVIK